MNKKTLLLCCVIFLTCSNSCNCVYICISTKHNWSGGSPLHQYRSKQASMNDLVEALEKDSDSKAKNPIHPPISPLYGTEHHFLFLHKILKLTVTVKATDWWYNLQRFKIIFVPSQETSWKATVKAFEHEDRKKTMVSTSWKIFWFFHVNRWILWNNLLWRIEIFSAG